VVARLVEQARDVLPVDVFDLLDANQRRLPALALELLRERLELSVPRRGIRQEVRRALERPGAERSEPAPDTDAEARGVGGISKEETGWRKACVSFLQH